MKKPGSVTGIGHTAMMLAAMLPTSMAQVVTSVYLITVVGLSPLVAGSYGYGTTVVGIVALYFAGRGGIDRLNPSWVFCATALMSAAGLICVLLVDRSPLLLVPAVLLVGLGQIGGPALFVYADRYGPLSDKDQGNLFRTRQLISIGWILGPPLAFFLFWYAGFGLVVLAVIALRFAALAFMMVAAARQTPKARLPTQAGGQSQGLIGFWPILTIMVLAACANVLHSINLPLHLIEDLGAPAFWPGIIISTAALVEVLVISALPRMSAAFSDELVLIGGLVVGLLYFPILWVVKEPAIIAALQVVYGLHFAATTVVCLPLLKRATAKATGSLASQFLNASKVGSVLGTAAFALAAGAVGYLPLLTVVCPILLAVALIVALVGGRSQVGGPKSYSP